MISGKQAGTTRIEPVKRTGNNCLVGDVNTWQEGKKGYCILVGWIGLDWMEESVLFSSFLFFFFSHS